MTNMDKEQAYHLQRFYCIALVALVDELLGDWRREHGGEGPKELAARLVTEARGRGSDDDRTAIVMRVEKTNF